MTKEKPALVPPVSTHFCRSCKRDSFLSILQAMDFVEEQLGISMERSPIVCRFSGGNNQCIGKRCPFSPANH